MSKHTPGPWKFGRAGHPKDGAYDWGLKAYVDGNFEVIAETFGRSSEAIYPPAEANAKLIAAAPDMFAAMQEFVERVDKGEVRSTYTYNQFKAIIAEATS